MSTQGFGEGPTRQIQPGDTPDLNDGLLSRNVPTSTTILRGDATYLINGDVTIATQALARAGHTPFVPIESIDNQSADPVPISGVGPPQRVALQVKEGSNPIDPGEFVLWGHQ